MPVKAAGLMMHPDGVPDTNPRPEPGDVPYPEATKTLAADVESGVAVCGEIGPGATAAVDRVEFGIRKTPPDADLADREELGALVGYAVGARVPAVHRPAGGDGRVVFLQYGSAPMAMDVDDDHRRLGDEPGWDASRSASWRRLAGVCRCTVVRRLSSESGYEVPL
ncbi:hypothetical protein AAH991_38140 [Microbispora sp. ZYX-F-249]|uniref:Uncharacterized protein n=1 Tax=Microbispora maris TaxID=3144104 RepID=A0ABV0B1P3_9ACTN